MIDHIIVPILHFSLNPYSCHVTLNFIPLGAVCFSASLMLGLGHVTCFSLWNMRDSALVPSLGNNRNYMFLLFLLVFLSSSLEGHIPHSIRIKGMWNRATGTELQTQNLNQSHSSQFSDLLECEQMLIVVCQ